MDSLVDKLPAHPFYPLDIIFEGYVPNTWGLIGILVVFGAACLAVMFSTFTLVRAFSPSMRKSDQACVNWFVVSGAIHLIVEGYFVYNHRVMYKMDDWLGQAWKEYAKSDSRYMTSDPTVLSVEMLAACALGPGCLLTAYLIYTNSPWRHPVQVLTSFGQLYGVIIYYGANFLDWHLKRISYSVPGFGYFWIFYFGLNFVWVIIPALCVYRSSVHTASAFAHLKRTQGNSYGNGPVKTNEISDIKVNANASRKKAL